MFPAHIRKGKNQPPTLEWVYKRCEDGKGIVAPRDVIDLMREAKRSQEMSFTEQPVDQEWLLPAEAINAGFIEMSKKKKDLFLKAEFKHLSGDIDAFENGKAEYDNTSLEDLLGHCWESKIKVLTSIGFMCICQGFI
jgi:hypothetical protein